MPSLTTVPAVRHRVGRTRVLFAALLTLWLPGLGLVLWMIFLESRLATRAGATIGFVALVTVSGLVLLRFWCQQVERDLSWDGARWSLSQAGRLLVESEQQPQVRLDLQSALLLHWAVPTRRRGVWLWTQAGDNWASWHLLRCALYSRGLSDEEPGSASGADPA